MTECGGLTGGVYIPRFLWFIYQTLVRFIWRQSVSVVERKMIVLRSQVIERSGRLAVTALSGYTSDRIPGRRVG